MKLDELGEFGLIKRIAPHFKPTAEDVVGIGDDCAVLPREHGRVELVTTDLLIEQVHFMRDRIPPDALGHKALAVNLSDIAAMGGTPTAAFLSLGLPGNVDVEWVDRFFVGVKALSERCGCPLLGGDTTASPRDIVINVAVLGEANRDEVKLRSGARPGDVIAVSGCLGDSGAGWRLLKEDVLTASEDARALIRSHQWPTPHLAEGRWLARHAAVHALMDVSDGIASDLPHMLRQSGIGGRVRLDALPISPALRAVCRLQGWSEEELALCGGEDYGLLCAIEGPAFEEVASAFRHVFGRPLYDIGTAQAARELQYERGGKPVTPSCRPFEHFSKASQTQAG